MTVPEILYICDHRACERCNGIEGCYTTDISHAVNFAKIKDFYFEKEPSMDETKTTIDNPGAVVDPIETKEIEMTPEEAQKAWNEMKRRHKKKPLAEEKKADHRFWNFIDIVYKLAKMSGLYIEGHIKVRDKKTGKVWE